MQNQHESAEYTPGLIAAAPELLEALEAMIKSFSLDEDSWNRQIFEDARAALSKAKGQS